MLSFTLFLWSSILGCSGGATSPAVPPSGVGAEVAPAAAPTVPPAPAPVVASGLMEGIAGWPGFWATEEDAMVRHPQGEVVALSTPNLDAAAGDSFVAIGKGGSSPVQYLEQTTVPVGCNDTPTGVSVWDAQTAGTDGFVWIAPQDAGAQFSSISLEESPRTSDDVRSWTVGALEVRLEKTGENTGTLGVWQGGQAIHSEAFEKHFMEGADESPLDLYDGWEVGRPTPVAAWQVSPSETVLLQLEHRGYEGISWTVWALQGGTRTAEGMISLYLCAF